MTIQTILQKYNIYPSKKLGQNFINNPKICEQIITNLDLHHVDAILEIGPGLGVLTQQLLTLNIPVIAIEIDKRLSVVLRKNYVSPHLTIITHDALKLDWFIICKSSANVILVANIPYIISSQIILKFLQTTNIHSAYLMVQTEMAERIMAHVSTHQYNAFTILVQYYASVEKILNVSATNFYPQPQVDSTVVRIVKTDKFWDDKFALFLRRCFMAKRQTLWNNLKLWYDKKLIKDVFDHLKFDYKIRAENIAVNLMHQLYQKFEPHVINK
ncbi:MAG: 16S rRNA (adenine(1518)-N(6)/adenine(1519)-N(6))-dimethyltransferase RsmA [Mycoplasmataceae bacterium]|nr:16S rRNA (adenine(1518)-N(6)/adenine(1519)-N(6))-dimethyltransferase RsmA [Mycoplasmataceae bacterium]